MAKSVSCDILVAGQGVAGALTALAAAAHLQRHRGKPLSVALVVDPGVPEDLAAASYTFINPQVASAMPALRSKLASLTAGAFKRMVVLGSAEHRRGEFRNRAIVGYFVDGAALLRGLLSLCRAKNVTLVKPSSPATYLAGDEHVRAVWPGGVCEGRVALIADPQIIVSGRAEAMGFPHHWLANRLTWCYGMTLPASSARLRAAYSASPPLVTAWQLSGPSLGPEAHAWLLPKRNAVSLGVMTGSRTPVADPTALLSQAADEAKLAGLLPEGAAAGCAVQAWQLPLAGALEIESHTAKRSLAVGLAGGFASAFSGQWIYPVAVAAVQAAAVAAKALADPRPQDELCNFGARWRQKLADYLRSPNTRLPFLLPFVFNNQQIADRFSKAFLFGETF